MHHPLKRARRVEIGSSSMRLFKKKPDRFQAVIFYCGNRVPSCWGSQGLVPGMVPQAGFGHELSLFVEKASPSTVLPACSRLLLPRRCAKDPLPAVKAGPSIFFNALLCCLP